MITKRGATLLSQTHLRRTAGASPTREMLGRTADVQRELLGRDVAQQTRVSDGAGSLHYIFLFYFFAVLSAPRHYNLVTEKSAMPTAVARHGTYKAVSSPLPSLTQPHLALKSKM